MRSSGGVRSKLRYDAGVQALTRSAKVSSETSTTRAKKKTK